MENPQAIIRRNLELLIEPGTVVELRALLLGKGTISGYFNNLDALAATATHWEDFSSGVYLTLNPVRPELLARAANQVVKWPKSTTTDGEILRRTWLLLDFDPVRPTGISSTEAEHQTALDRAKSCREWLRSLVWPEPLLCDSGNGAHLLYRINLSNDRESADMIRAILQAVALRFSDEAVDVDQAVFNAARLTKAYGTLARKGSSTKDRPHRRSQILEAPARIEVVAVEKLREVAAMRPEPPSRNGKTSRSGFDIERWISERGLNIARTGPWGGGGRKWVLRSCPWDENHKDTSAYIVQLANGAISAGCKHNGCAGKDWHALRDEVEPGWRARRPTTGAHTDGDEWEAPVPFAVVETPPFPLEALPAWLKDFVEAVAEETQTPPDMAAMLALAVCAAALAKKFRIIAGPGYSEPLNIYAVVILPPANRKSAVFATVTRPIREYEQELVEETRDEIVEARNRRKILEGRLEQAQKLATKAKPAEKTAREEDASRLARELEAAEVPATPRLIADDATVEKLASILREQGGRIAVMSAEGIVFDLLAGMYSKSGIPNFGVYINAHNGDDIRVDRVGRPSEFVKSPALTTALTVQPDFIQGLADKPTMKGRGLLGRFLYSWPESLLGRRKIGAPSVPASVAAAYRARVRDLLRLPFATGEDGKPAPNYLRLSEEARDRFIEFQSWLEPMLGPHGDLRPMADWAGKFAGAVLRIMGILHMAGCVGKGSPWQREVSHDTVECAIRIGRYLLEHARATYSEMAADPKIEEAKHILRWLSKTGADTLTAREIFNGVRGRFKKMDALESAFDLLGQHGYLRQRVEDEHRGPGRKPSPTYEVNPLWLAQITQNPQNQGSAASSADIAESAAPCDNPDAGQEDRLPSPPQSDGVDIPLAGGEL